MKKIAVIGDKFSVTAFKACGMDVYTPQEAGQTEEIITQLVKQDYAVILITEDIAQSVSQFILQYKSQVYPIILPIPASSGSTGLGIGGLKYNVEKAIGMDILFDKEGRN